MQVNSANKEDENQSYSYINSPRLRDQCIELSILEFICSFFFTFFVHANIFVIKQEGSYYLPNLQYTFHIKRTYVRIICFSFFVS